MGKIVCDFTGQSTTRPAEKSCALSHSSTSIMAKSWLVIPSLKKKMGKPGITRSTCGYSMQQRVSGAFHAVFVQLSYLYRKETTCASLGNQSKQCYAFG
ncbi:unnamed protein product [Protopolystoma xenopodis]|uniref:Uncharacterized protein n=1 Tax=Protopolystoma xenopodis TaxID=117903 RepID=A0A3S5BBM5_9PLAT|nr:unnamed protein product [Protopolystoma xenopodis]